MNKIFVLSGILILILLTSIYAKTTSWDIDQLKGKVKSISMDKYVIDPETGQQVLEMVNMVTYDPQGYLQNWQITVGDNEYTINGVYHNQYDDKGNIIQCMQVNNQGEQYITTSFYYDQQNRLIKKFEDSAYPEELDITYYYYYNTDGRLVQEKIEYGQMGIIESKYVFGPEGQPLSIEHTSSQAEPSQWRTELSYADGRVVGKEGYDPLVGEWWRETYEYDAQGNVIETRHYTIIEADGVAQVFLAFLYKYRITYY